MIELTVFLILAILSVISAFCVILPPFGRNPLHSAIALIACFFFIAGIYVMLLAHLVAAIQIIVYAGAVVVLFTFVIMLLNLSKEELKGAKINFTKIIGGFLVLFIFVKMISAIIVETEGVQGVNLTSPERASFGSIETVGSIIVKDYLFPFELTSILLLVAIIGAVIIAKKKDEIERK